jgi:hypothetical protein
MYHRPICLTGLVALLTQMHQPLRIAVHQGLHLLPTHVEQLQPLAGLVMQQVGEVGEGKRVDETIERRVHQPPSDLLQIPHHDTVHHRAVFVGRWAVGQAEKAVNGRDGRGRV